MKVQEVILRARAKRLTWWQAAEILGISVGSLRRWRGRYEQYGYDPSADGFDRRRGRPSPKRVPLGTGEEVLRLYQEKYPDFNVRHFHEKLREEHGIRLSYTWLKLALPGAGSCLRPGAGPGPGSDLLHPTRARGGSGQHRQAGRAGLADRESTLAGDAGWLSRAQLGTLGRPGDHPLRAARGGPLHVPGRAPAPGRGTARAEKRQLWRRPSSPPSKVAQGGSILKPDTSCAIKTGHLHVLATRHSLAACCQYLSLVLPGCFRRTSLIATLG
jgi:transposase